MADLAQVLDDPAGARPADPVLAAVAATGAFAIALFAAPPALARQAHAHLFGLRGADSLRPWIEEGLADVEELARRDYEPEHGAGWRVEWERRLDETFALIDGRLGPGWTDGLAEKVAA